MPREIGDTDDYLATNFADTGRKNLRKVILILWGTPGRTGHAYNQRA